MALIAYILVKLSAKTILKPLDLRSLYLKRPSLKTMLLCCELKESMVLTTKLTKQYHSTCYRLLKVNHFSNEQPESNGHGELDRAVERTMRMYNLDNNSKHAVRVGFLEGFTERLHTTKPRSDFCFLLENLLLLTLQLIVRFYSF